MLDKEKRAVMTKPAFVRQYRSSTHHVCLLWSVGENVSAIKKRVPGITFKFVRLGSTFRSSGDY